MLGPQWPKTRQMFQRAALVAPLIGLIVGLAFYWIHKAPRLGRVFGALLSLYVAAAMFGLAVGVFAGLREVPPMRGATRNLPAVVFNSVGATLWGLTFMGYVVVLWPLAYLNHALLGHLSGITPSAHAAKGRQRTQ